MNTYVKYESCITTGAHTIGNYTFLQKKVKGQGHKFKQLIWLERPCPGLFLGILGKRPLANLGIF